jgi:hypothetical protein
VIENKITKKFRNWNELIWSSYEFSVNYTNSNTYFYIKNSIFYFIYSIQISSGLGPIY